ncbi:MAG TPA: CBS domain-containing protein [Nitrospiraceae bacterium]|jgi:CBS domain-containing protein|nr:CBS domain-containing protein [Nitrospiraceae bacterium]
MGKKSKVGQGANDVLDEHIEELHEALRAFQPFLSRRKNSASLEAFDADTEELIGEVFGASSDALEAYQYAKLGETGLLPEEAQEAGAHDLERQSLHQRKQVLESCLAKLELKKATRAGRQKRQTVSELLDGLKVADFMCSDVRSVHRAASIKEAGRLLQKWRVGSLLVDDGSRYIGIITDTDLSRKAVARGLDPNSTTVVSCMSKSLVTIEDSEPLMEAVKLMKKEGIRHLPVTEDGTIIGLLSVADLLRAYEKVSD